MKKRSWFLYFLLLTIGAAFLAGCGSEREEKAEEAVSDAHLIYEETISPNEADGVPEEDLVYDTVKIYQREDHQIILYTESNSAFFEPMQYELAYDKEITEADIEVQWTTIMGNPEPSEGDQLAIALVSIMEEGEVYGHWKISFVNQGIEWIEEAVQK
ncbi:hypothetical protein H9X85_08750 [Anaerotignum lactatifermentans]|uniref:DUF5067 domain-containing protein n=1 Tax=Anaerotignum lactatifermentans TaxID=160404 RepID=A0ABS2GAL6_9FIRM|nr:hypothetical protein [Anaerotignum lactatifermentans]MBM6829848.1 hypothetical protein [Anaerotignum lactatifermentans]MBM6878212.1 hypothetical protein [Anaerotignum lactatifermentans]MBM6951292.1 hypothetical protein [Anaerotignum lactatifermentans]